jgi:hypothetical protein
MELRSHIKERYLSPIKGTISGTPNKTSKAELDETHVT